MDVNDLKELYAESKKRMDGQLEYVRRELAGVRTGRASTGLLENIMVEAYGSKLPLNQVATLSIPEPSLIVAQPFDPSMMGSLERAIRLSDLGLNPASDGKVLRIPIPSLTDERRKDLSRHVHKAAEEGRNHIRTVRRDANDKLKKMLKEHQISEDDEKRGLDEVQKITDGAIRADRRPAEEEGRRTAREIGGARASGPGAEYGAARRLGISRDPRPETRAPMFFSHLECSTPCGAGPFDAHARHHLCPGCGMPLLARYDMARARAWSRDSLAGRAPTMWRYREMLPLFPGETPITLGEGFTPLLRACRLGDDGRPRAPAHQGRVAQSDQLVQGARTVGGRDPRQSPWRDHHHTAHRRQCRQRRGRLRRRRRHAAARSSCRATPSSPSSTNARSTAPTSRWWTASSPTPGSCLARRPASTAGTTSPR